MGELPDADVRTLLSGAWLDAVDHRDFGGHAPDAEVAAGLRRLATAVEVRLFMDTGLDIDARRASAFVAAESLGVVRDLGLSEELEPASFGSTLRFETVEEALLYLVAGFDANAALTAKQIGSPPEDLPEEDVSEWALSKIRALVDHAQPLRRDPGPDAGPGPLRDRVRHELWRRIGTAVDRHVRWLRMLDERDPTAAELLLELAIDLRARLGASPGVAAHPDLHHLCLLLAAACEETAGRALRRVPSSLDDGGRFLAYQRGRSRTMPLLWPAAAIYADLALPGPRTHAVVAVPTGAGKSAVAELGIAQAVRTGWVLYLAPTNALVAQARRDLTRSIGKLDGVTIKTFTGGAEYTRMAGETLELITESEVLVMTPEKCSLALRQNAAAFESLALCILDEAHLIGDPRSRGVVAELVIAEVLHRSPKVRILLLSALIDDPKLLASWLRSATGTDAIAIDEPWRPTRTLRALCGVASEECEQLAKDAARELADLPPRRKNLPVPAPLRLLGALHGAWTGERQGDYAIIDTGLTTLVSVNRSGVMSRTGHTSPTTRVLTQALALAGHRVLVFLPSDRNAPFSQARTVDGIPADPEAPRPGIDALLVLADAELAGVAAGQVTEVRPALAKQVAIHTSVMLPEEQRASEIAFETGVASIMFATGTLAQGLNLPATAVVIGGTVVGDRRDAASTDGRARAKAQLLNAIGRAGRAQTAARSLAIVVPDQPLLIAATPAIAAARQRASFLEDEDGSVAVCSRLDGLIAQSLDGSLRLQTMSVPEQTAFAFLSFTAESGDTTAVLSRSLAAHAAGASANAVSVTDALRSLGRQFLDHERAPAWIAMAAHRAGVTLLAAVELYRRLGTILATGAPYDVEGWASVLLRVLSSMSEEARLILLPHENLESTAVALLSSQDADERDKAWAALGAALGAWLTGQPLTVLGAALHDQTAPITASRVKGREMPRTLKFVRNVLEHDLTAAAGALVATIVTGIESDPDGPWILSSESSAALMRLPVAIRSGASDPGALTLLQMGMRPRAVAYLLSQRSPVFEGADDLDRRIWATELINAISDPDRIGDLSGDPNERRLITAAAYVSHAL